MSERDWEKNLLRYQTTDPTHTLQRPVQGRRQNWSGRHFFVEINEHAFYVIIFCQPSHFVNCRKRNFCLILSILYIGDGYIYISFFFFFRECKCVELFRYVVRFLTCIDSNKLINMHKPDSQCKECITKIKSVHHYRSIYYRESYKMLH